jgi:hypothetical protein
MPGDGKRECATRLTDRLIEATRAHYGIKTGSPRNLRNAHMLQLEPCRAPPGAGCGLAVLWMRGVPSRRKATRTIQRHSGTG